MDSLKLWMEFVMDIMRKHSNTLKLFNFFFSKNINIALIMILNKM